MSNHSILDRVPFFDQGNGNCNVDMGTENTKPSNPTQQNDTEKKHGNLRRLLGIPEYQSSYTGEFLCDNSMGL